MLLVEVGSKSSEWESRNGSRGLWSRLSTHITYINYHTVLHLRVPHPFFVFFNCLKYWVARDIFTLIPSESLTLLVLGRAKSQSI